MSVRHSFCESFDRTSIGVRKFIENRTNIIEFGERDFYLYCRERGSSFVKGQVTIGYAPEGSTKECLPVCFIKNKNTRSINSLVANSHNNTI